MPKIDFSNPLALPDYFSSEVLGGTRFFLGGSGQRGLHVVAAGAERVTPTYAIHRKRFPYIGIEFVAAGEGVLNISGKEWPLQPGIAFCYGPRTPHQIRTHPKNRLLKYFVDFEGSDAKSLAERSGLGPGTVLQSARPATIMSIFDELIRSGSSPNRFTDEVCRHLLCALVYRIAETAVAPESFHSTAFSTYAAIRSDLEAHAIELVSLGQLADRNRIDEAYLCRLFARFDFESPYQKLQRLRMQHAAEQLQRGDRLVKQVALELGFSDQFHFSRTFKRVLGVAPSHLLRESS